jgi:hypothetical protein
MSFFSADLIHRTPSRSKKFRALYHKRNPLANNIAVTPFSNRKRPPNGVPEESKKGTRALISINGKPIIPTHWDVERGCNSFFKTSRGAPVPNSTDNPTFPVRMAARAMKPQFQDRNSTASL